MCVRVCALCSCVRTCVCVSVCLLYCQLGFDGNKSSAEEDLRLLEWGGVLALPQVRACVLRRRGWAWHQTLVDQQVLFPSATLPASGDSLGAEGNRAVLMETGQGVSCCPPGPSSGPQSQQGASHSSTWHLAAVSLPYFRAECPLLAESLPLA